MFNRRRLKRKIKTYSYLVVGVSVLFLLFVSYQMIKAVNFENLTKSILGISKQATPSPNSNIGKDLKETVEKAMDGTEGNYAILIRNIKTGESYASNEHRSYDAGSLYKLWVMATVYKKIEEGKLKEDQELSQDIATLNRKFGIDDGSAEFTEGAINLTVGQALTQMITISHNYAALLLTEKVGLSQVSEFVKQNGFKESGLGTKGGSPETTVFDMALFFEKLYKKELGNEESTNKMIELLKRQRLNDKLPKYLPEGTIVAHKTGEIDYFSHDAGIVYSGKGDYIIAVLSESDFPAGAEDRIARLSRSVYEYFEN